VEGAVFTPLRQELAGSPVAILRLVTGLGFRQIDADRVARAAPEQLLVQLGPDHVVGRADDRVEVARDLGIEPKPTNGRTSGNVAPKQPVFPGGGRLSAVARHVEPPITTGTTWIVR